MLARIFVPYFYVGHASYQMDCHFSLSLSLFRHASYNNNMGSCLGRQIQVDWACAFIISPDTSQTAASRMHWWSREQQELNVEQNLRHHTSTRLLGLQSLVVRGQEIVTRQLGNIRILSVESRQSISFIARLTCWSCAALWSWAGRHDIGCTKWRCTLQKWD